MPTSPNTGYTVHFVRPNSARSETWYRPNSLAEILNLSFEQGMIMEKRIAKLDERTKQLVNQVKNRLITIYGEKIKDVILYGSHVRGEPTKDSDIDLLVLIDSSLVPFEVRRSLSDLLFDILLEDGELVSVVVLPEDFFKNYN